MTNSFESELKKLILSDINNSEKCKALLTKFESMPKQFRDSSRFLIGYKDCIPLLMDDGQYHKGHAFIFAEPDEEFLGYLIRSHIVRPSCIELAKILGCRDIRYITFDELDIHGVLKTEDVEDLLNERIIYGKQILQECIEKGYISDRIIEKTNLLSRLQIKKETLINKSNDIDLLKSTNESLEIQLNNTQTALEEAEVSIEIMQAELQRYRELSSYYVPSENIPLPNDFECRSLCITYTDTNNRNRIKRIADVTNNVFYEDLIENAPTYSHFYNMDGPTDDGYIGVWDWRVIPNMKNPERDYIESVFRKNIIPIEIIIIDNCRNISEIITFLKDGLAVLNHSEKMIFAYRNGDLIEGVYCHLSSLVINMNTGIITVSSNVLNLPVYQFGSKDIIHINKITILRKLELGIAVRLVGVNDPIIIAKNIILRKINWTIMRQHDFTREQYRKFRDFLSELPTTELYADVASACNCDDEEAKQLIECLVKKADSYITANTPEADVLVDILRNNDSLYESCLQSVRLDWQKQNSTEIQQAQNRLDKIIQEAEDYRIVVEQQKAEYHQLSEKLTETRKALENQENFANDVHNRILVKIEEAKRNAAEFFAQQVLAYPGLLSVPTLNLSLFLEESTIETNDIDYYDTWNDLFFNLTTELQEAGVAQNRAKGLAVLLYAAYVHKIPILLAGPNGEDIAKAFSAVLYARTPAMLRCEGNGTFKAIAACEQSNAEVVLITQPFEREWYQSILRLVSRRDKFYILTHSFKEDLIIEPNGLYNYCLPVLTELFVDSAPNGNYIPSMPSDQYKHFCEKRNGNPYAGLWKQIGITSLAQNNIQTIIWIIHRIFPSSKGTFDYLQILSLAYATEQIQTLIKYIDGLVESEKPSSKVLEQIKRWAGEE